MWKVKKNKNQETDGYGRDKRPEIEKLKGKEITIAETRKTEMKKNRKAVRISMKSVRRGARCLPRVRVEILCCIHVFVPASCTGADQVLEVGELEGSAGSKASARLAEQMESDGCRRRSWTAVPGVCQSCRTQVRRDSPSAGWWWGLSAVFLACY